MFYTHGYARARGFESQGVKINADEHSLSAQSLISAKEKGGTLFLHPTKFQQRKYSAMPQEEVQMPQQPVDLPPQAAAGVNAPEPQPAAGQVQLTAEQKLEVNFGF